MPAYEDLSSHPMNSPSGIRRVYVGWLDVRLDYPRGLVDREILRRIGELCNSPVRRTRGWHRCALCSDYPIQETIGSRLVTLGDAEIDVMGPERIYSSPTLLYHYILRHEYRPPEEFLEAIRALNV